MATLEERLAHLEHRLQELEVENEKLRKRVYRWGVNGLNPLLVSGDEWIDSAQIRDLTADKLTAGTGIIENLDILAKLTLGTGGSIVDADGSTWSEDGITLRATDSFQDQLIIENPNHDHRVILESTIDSDDVQSRLAAQYDTGSGTELDSRVYVGGQDVSGTLMGTAGVQAARGGLYLAQLEVGVDENGNQSAKLFGNLFSLNIALNSSGNQFGGGAGVVHIGPAATAPTSDPASGYLLYVDPADEHLKARGPNGTVTTLATD